MSSTIYFSFKKNGWNCSLCSSNQDYNQDSSLFLRNIDLSIINNENDDNLNVNDDVVVHNELDYNTLISGKGLRFCHCNINSIRSKFDDVKEFLNVVSPLCIAFTESKLEKNRDLDATYLLPNYNTLRFDRDINNSDFVHGGGTINSIQFNLY
jgi:hypothetical protein